MKIAGSKSVRRLMRLHDPNPVSALVYSRSEAGKGFGVKASLRWAGLVVLGRDRLGRKWGAPVLLKTHSLSQAWGLPGKHSVIMITGIEIMYAKKKTNLKAAGPVCAHAHPGRIVRLLLFHGDYKGVGNCPLDMARRVRVFWPIAQI
jgi:hypothetical protein